MRKAKVKSSKAQKPRAAKTAKNRPRYRRPAIRSEAFFRAVRNAKAYAADPESLRQLFEEAASKAASIPKEPFKDSWAYLQAMLRLIRAYSRGEYRAVPQSALFSIISAINYLVDPFDLIPDEIPFLGFLDDATVIAFTVQKTREDLDDFMTWETIAIEG
jgi:uncharacterized membrane protein YkvA (DUF1232 family)